MLSKTWPPIHIGIFLFTLIENVAKNRENTIEEYFIEEIE
jgi:hypothetical protein